MVERKDIINGILIIILLGGNMLQIVDDPNRNYGVCIEGWKLQEDGTYSCLSRSINGEYCYQTTLTRCYYGIKYNNECNRGECIKLGDLCSSNPRGLLEGYKKCD